MTPAPTPWLEIDLKGFAQVLRNKGIARILLEPISNALDTEAASIEVEFTQSEGRARLTVLDDDPEGFADLRDSYTLFAPSKRRADPTKRGRFGQGDKELIAICHDNGHVEVASTSGSVVFDKRGRTQNKRVLPSGTKLTAEFRCNQTQAKEFRALVAALLVPPSVKLSLDSVEIPSRVPFKTVKASLATKLEDEEGNLSDATRTTEVELYEPQPGEKAAIYELGVPVVEHDGRWHCNVLQKVPLNTARDNVNPAYLRRLRELMLNETFEDLTSVDFKKAWVKDAEAKATPEALRTMVHAVHGPDAVIYDPSNPEASKRAIDQGRSVVYGRSYSPDTWNRIKENDILRPAGQVIETGVPSNPEGKPPIPRDQWTPAMETLADYTMTVGRYLLNMVPTVSYEMANIGDGSRARLAWWGGGTITFNLGWLGKRWPESATEEQVDELLIHEFAHHLASDHFSDKYIHATCELGAKLRSCSTHLPPRVTP